MKVILTENQLKRLLFEWKTSRADIDAGMNINLGQMSQDNNNEEPAEQGATTTQQTPASVNYKVPAGGNERHIMSSLMSAMGWNEAQAGAMCAIIASESACNPAAYNKGEYAAGSMKFGEGLIQWTFMERKVRAASVLFNGDMRQAENFILGARKYIDSGFKGQKGGIVSLTLDQQIRMIVGELSPGGAFDKVGLAVKRCKTGDEALRTLYKNYVAGSHNVDTIPSQGDVDATRKKYIAKNGVDGWQRRVNAYNSIMNTTQNA